jgi:hypothetical protein
MDKNEWLSRVRSVVKASVLDVEEFTADQKTYTFALGLRGVVVLLTETDAHIVPSIAAGSSIASRLEARVQHLDATSYDLCVLLDSVLASAPCKTILEDRGAPVPKGMKDLVSATLATLNLVPSTVHEAKKGAEAIKTTLLALDTALLGVSELRLLYSGHGRSIRAGGLGARHAALAVGAAVTVVEFLIATHAEIP